MAQRYLVFERVLDRTIQSRGVAAAIPIVIMQMTVVNWDALIPDMREAERTRNEAQNTWGLADHLVGSKTAEVKDRAQRVRRIGINNFGPTNPDVAERFRAVKTTAKSPLGVLSTGQAIEAAWKAKPR